MLSTIHAFWKDDRGLETVEYAVMTALIVTALVTAITLLSGSVSGRFTKVQGTIDGIP